jgi:hypothetical protein
MRCWLQVLERQVECRALRRQLRKPMPLCCKLIPAEAVFRGSDTVNPFEPERVPCEPKVLRKQRDRI